MTPRAAARGRVGTRFRSWAHSACPQMTVANLPLLLSQGNDTEEPKGVTSEGSRPCPPAPSPALASKPAPQPLRLVPLEFDKFLEERAKAADRLPNLSSPSAEGPLGPPRGTAPRKKTQEKDEDMLFAL